MRVLLVYSFNRKFMEYLSVSDRVLTIGDAIHTATIRTETIYLLVRETEETL